MKLVTKEHCFHCFDVIIAHLESKWKEDVKHPVATFEDGAYPLFVTWSKNGNDEGELVLRGCIGNFSAMPLRTGLTQYALLRVSLLHSFEDGINYLDWEIGKHGIRIEFVDHRGKRQSSTYLPEVALEHQWTKEHAIRSLVRKGGFQGQVTDTFLLQVKLQRYQSDKLQVPFREYKTHKSPRVNGVQVNGVARHSSHSVSFSPSRQSLTYMYSRYPPQSRVPTLVPQGIDRLWYPTQMGVADMHDELAQEEESYNNSLSEVRHSSSHYIPVGASKPYVDLNEEEDEEEEEDDDDDDDDDDGPDVDGEDDDNNNNNSNNNNNNDDLGMDAPDLDADIEDADNYPAHDPQIYSPTDDMLYGGYEPVMYTHGTPGRQQQQRGGGLASLVFAAELQGLDMDDPPLPDFYDEGP
ncbi:AMME syndrome candidate protein 1 protein [Podila verticillata]|nr:AMME syndrome candidate protein 1 protein [Podila verticillata]